MKTPRSARLCLVAMLSLAMPFTVRAEASAGLQNTTLIIIRHAEKPEKGEGAGLTPAGEKRANSYVAYFEKFKVDSQPLKLDYLFAARDSKASERPALTLEPLSKALGLPINTEFKNKDYQEMVGHLHSAAYNNKTILICWHHGEIPELLSALGANPDQLLPKKGKWPKEVFGLVIELRYDEKGHLKQSHTLHENS